jgi:acyl carrier protein
MSSEHSELKQQIKRLMVENLMLQVTECEITDEMPLFGAGGLGLDSVDALQLVVALDKQFRLKIADPNAAREVLQTVNTIARAVHETLQASAGSTLAEHA